ncbi:MAG: lysylphosphatidylglycerol synthase transmembrane domain-containing protein [Lachnospiraceae bacterium]
MRGKTKQLIWKLIFLLAIAGLAYYAFRDSFGQIAEELVKTPAGDLAVICLCALIYQCLDGAAITLLAKRYNPAFRYRHGIGCSYYTAFFKAITMGSGDLFASMYYYTEHGIPPEKNYGLITVFYVVQKITITLYCVVCLLGNDSYMLENYRQYLSYFGFGIVLTVIVAAVLIFVCISEKFHTFLLFLANKVIKKETWRQRLLELTEKLKAVREETVTLIEDRKLLLGLLTFNALKLTAWYLVPVVLLRHSKASGFPILSMIAATAALAGVMPAPAGIGSTEFVYFLLFTPLLGDVRAASSVLLYRFATFLFPSVLGGIYFLLTYVRKRAAKDITDSGFVDARK